MDNIPKLFGSMVFDQNAMKNKLPANVYYELLLTLENNSPLNPEIANHVANAMKEWATEKGATHFTHWFQPMTGITAEKHESFITPVGNNEVIMDFSGKELIKGEPDASSFPSGGLRATFEARGYTAWDPTSPAFVKDNTLFIPTTFCSYSGEVLDKKTPLLRSMNALNTQVKKILSFCGINDIQRVMATVGAEQEYFLIDKDLYKKRKDLIFCNRTLFGAKPPKGQELEDHYFGSLKPRVSAYMYELDQELWKLGILSKTKHNEVAPSQHELAPIFTTANISTDHNQLTMELMKKVADKHGFACLLHEKPFAGINGSGKHNNWSICGDCGTNLLDPGEHPEDNMVFIILLVAIIKAVDTYPEILRVSCASPGNDHRLGGHEAPPAIISMFIGDELTAILESIMYKKTYIKSETKFMEIGIDSTPNFRLDTTDRNRTSPLAFTGNKFEFRMPGSNMSIAGPNIILNTIVADTLEDFASKLETTEIDVLLSETLKSHWRIIFNGNNYSKEWIEEAKKRGLPNLKTSVDTFPHFISEKSISLFERQGIFTKEEVKSRYRVLLEGYSKTIHIEALTMIDMVYKDILPALIKYTGLLSSYAKSKKSLSEIIDVTAETDLIIFLSSIESQIKRKADDLSSLIIEAKQQQDELSISLFYKDFIIEKMNELRFLVDEAETAMPKDLFPYPTYSELLFSI